jgi:SAM-dependent methyltransferase
MAQPTDADFHKATWANNLTEESDWWDGVFAGTSPYSQAFIDALQKDAPFNYGSDADSFADETIRVLDVGAGPNSRLGSIHPGKTIEIHAIDPLADVYREKFKKHGLKEKNPVVNLAGEDLLTRYQPDTFHIAYSANALDHAFDPVLAIKNVVTTMKPNGVFYLMGAENEGQNNNYQGLHQWNFEVKGDDLVIWSPKSASTSMRSVLSNASVHARKAPDLAGGWHLTTIRKNPG